MEEQPQGDHGVQAPEVRSIIRAALKDDTGWHSWKALDDETPGRIRCNKCGLERWRIDDPPPDCPL